MCHYATQIGVAVRLAAARSVVDLFDWIDWAKCAGNDECGLKGGLRAADLFMFAEET